MLPESRFAKAVMIILSAVIILGLVASAFAYPVAL